MILSFALLVLVALPDVPIVFRAASFLIVASMGILGTIGSFRRISRDEKIRRADSQDDK